jgi:hypothetical protein
VNEGAPNAGWSREALVLALALLLVPAAGIASWWALVLAYAIGWLVVNAIAAAAPRALETRMTRASQWLVVLLAAVPATAWLARERDRLLDFEGLAGLAESFDDRLRLEHTPSIAPPMLFAGRPQELYVLAPDSESLSVRFGEARASVATALGSGLFRARYDPQRDGALSSGSIELVLDGGERVRRELEVVEPLAHPRWLCPSPDRASMATVSEETDELVLIDDGGLVRRVEVADAPTDCAFVSHDLVAVAHRFDPALWIVRASDGELVHRIEVGRFAAHLAAWPGARIAIAIEAPPRIAIVSDLANVAFVPLDRAPEWIAFGPDDRTLVISSRGPASLVRLRAGADGVFAADASLLLGRPAVTLARSLDGGSIAVATTDYRPDGTPNEANHFVQDQLLTIDTRTFEVISEEPTARRSDRQQNPGDVDRGGSPMGIEIGERTRRIAFAGTDEVWRIDPSEPAPAMISLRDLPLAAPHGIATFASGRWAVSSPSSGAIGIFAGEELVTLIALAPADDALLASDPAALERRMGEHGFYETTRSGIACQSCHLHAGGDRSLHDIGDHHLAPTLTVAGVAGTAPYLRDGSYARLRDLHELSTGLYRGFSRAAPGRALTLEAYVASLPADANPRLFGGRDLDRERAGFAAFRKARCDLCHRPPAFTNLGSHPLGALFPDRARTLGADTLLDTPSLIGAGRRSAFLADGRAHSLEEVLRDFNRSNRHGDSASLGDRELSDLVWFLESL